MKKTKKIIALFLTLAMAAVCTTGCKKKTEAVVDENGNYVPTKTLNLTIWNAQGTDFVRQDTSSESIPKKWLEEKTKVKVENIYGNDGGQWDTKLSRLIAGDNLPDILYVAGGQGPSHFKKLKDAKKLYPLTKELLEKYAPNVYARVPESYWELMSSDGEIMGIPFGFNLCDEKTQPDMTPKQREYLSKKLEPIVTDATGLYIRDDIAKKLYPKAKTYDEMCEMADETHAPIGEELYDIPINSTDDFIKMFKDIDALGLTENNKKVYSFGYNGGDLWQPLTILGAQMYGYATNNYITAWDPIEKKIITPLTDDLMKQAAKTQNQLVRAGIFDPESLVQTSASYKEKCINGLYAVTSLSYAGGEQSVNSQLKALGKSYRYRPLYTNVPQNEHYPLQYYQSNWTAALCFTDSMDENKVIQALNWINTQFSDEFEEILWWGTPEDGLYTEENGVRKYKDEAFNKAYIEGDSTALSVKDCKGLGSLIISPESEFYVLEGFYISRSRWAPSVMKMETEINSTSPSAFSCRESKTGAKIRPQSDVFDAPFAKIQQCVEFWAQRERWEAPFKTALGADSDESFDKQWSAAVDEFNSVTDIQTMRDEMTKIALAEAEQLGIK